MSEDIYQLYLDEIEAIPPCDMAENAALAVSLSAGDELAKKRLVEGNLKTALTHTKDYLNRGVTVNDLIQEANMALMLAVESYGALAAARMAETGMEGQEAHLVEGAFEQYLGLKIREALDAAVEAQAAESKVEEEMLARVNVMKDISQTMAEELGREATVEELAERLKMTVDEVKDIMKLTLDAMTLNGEYEE
ncbi:MAG: RNA polymerase subunit sigma-70 [Hungatella hathewayi]|nr:RNA polymerase subunit sigma-70 [Hungatella hathewayi]